MKSKQLITLVVVASVVVLVGVAVRSSRNRTWSGKAAEEWVGNVLPDFSVNEITKIVIKDDTGTVTAARKDGNWVIAEKYDYPAKFDALRDFLVDLKELRAAQELKVGPSQYGRLKLVEPDKGDTDKTGALVTFFGEGDKKLGSVLFGEEHKKKSEGAPPNPMMGMGGGDWPDGRYLLVPSSGRVVLVSKTFSNVKGDASSWIDKEFFKLGDIKEATLQEGDKVIWHASRETKSGSLKLEGEIPEGKEIDSGKLGSIKSAFSWASFSDVADPSLTDEDTGMDKAKIFTAREFDGFVYRVSIGKKTDDGKYYIRVAAEYDGAEEREAAEDETPEDKKKKDEEFAKKQKENQEKVDEVNARVEGWTYLVSKYTVDSVLKTRDDLLKDKPKPEKDEKKDGGAAEPAAGSAKGKPSPPASLGAAGNAGKKPPAQPPAKPAENEKKSANQ